MEEQYIMYKSKHPDGSGWILQIHAFAIDSVCIMLDHGNVFGVCNTDSPDETIATASIF